MFKRYQIFTIDDNYRIGTVIKDNNGSKWQLISKNKWVKYIYSYTHKTNHNLKNKIKE